MAEDKAKIVADLSISINIQGPGDEASQLKIGTDPKAFKRKPWMPASVQKQYKQLVIKFLKGCELPKMDTNLFSTVGGNYYVWINHMGNKMKTKVVDMEKAED